jgi:hypothetical protein
MINARYPKALENMKQLKKDKKVFSVLSTIFPP